MDSELSHLGLTSRFSRRDLRLIAEFTLIFFGVPLFLYFEPLLVHPSQLVIPALIGLVIYFRSIPGFKMKELISMNVEKAFIRKQFLIAITFGFICIIFSCFIQCFGIV